MLIIHHQDRAFTTSDNRRYPHDGSSTGCRQALAQLAQDTSLQQEASNRRSLQERGRPCTQQELENGWRPDDLRGPMERQVAELQKTASYNVAEARLAICKSQNIQSKEIPRLEQMAAEYVPNVAAPAESVSPYDVAIASLQEKPGLPEDRARNDLIVNRLREAGDKWKQDQAREAQVKAFESMPERINALENARATLRMAELIPAIPSFHLEASRQNLLALENSTDADGGVKAFWAQQRKDNIALHAHQDQQKADWTKRGEQHDADMKAALSLAPVEAPVVVERPKSAIETALMPPETPAP